MNWKTNMRWTLLAVCCLGVSFLGATAGCNKPGDATKRPPSTGAPPANTTDSK